MVLSFSEIISYLAPDFDVVTRNLSSRELDIMFTSTCFRLLPYHA